MSYSCQFIEKQVNWKDVCIAQETIQNWFVDCSDSAIKKRCHHYTSFCIDALQILKPPHRHLVVVGDRGGTLSIIALKDFLSNEEPEPVYTNNQAHNGWIWSVSSDSNVIASTSWDHELRVWSISDSGLDMFSRYTMGSAVLCSDFLDPNLVATGTFDRELSVFDYRAPNAAAALSNTYHRSTVLCLKSPYSITSASYGPLPSGFSSTTTLDFSDANSVVSNMGDVSTHDASEHSDLGGRTDLVSPAVSADDSTDKSPPPQNTAFYSGSKDGLLAAWDLRKFNQPIARRKFQSYPRKISLLDNEEMWVAERNRLHVFQTASSPVLTHLKSHKYPSNLGAISSLEATPGGVFLALMSRYLDAIHPTMPVRSMLKEPLNNNNSDIYIALSYAQETLLVGGDNGTISLFMSKRRANELMESESQGL
ncbi:hypothetical protein Aperf_G00000004032 [Anoplocephala perfoliata]